MWIDAFRLRSYELCPHMPLIIFFWIFLFITLFRDFAYRMLGRLVPSYKKVGEIEVDEDLDSYFNTIDNEDRNWTIKEEEYARNTLKIKTLSDETLEKFKKAKRGVNQMKGVHCYDILANPLYLDDF